MTPLAASTAVWVFILIPLLVVWVIGLVDIIRRDFPWTVKAGWIIVVLLLPIVGTVVYFALKKPAKAEIQRSQAAHRDRGEDWSRNVRSRRNPPG